MTEVDTSPLRAILRDSRIVVCTGSGGVGKTTTAAVIALEDRVGVKLGPVVVNGLYPELPGLNVDPVDAAAAAHAELDPRDADALRAAAAFRRHRLGLQTEQAARLAEALPLPQLQLPFLFTDRIGPAELDELAGAMTAEITRHGAPAA